MTASDFLVYAVAWIGAVVAGTASGIALAVIVGLVIKTAKRG